LLAQTLDLLCLRLQLLLLLLQLLLLFRQCLLQGVQLLLDSRLAGSQGRGRNERSDERRTRDTERTHQGGPLALRENLKPVLLECVLGR